MALVGGRVDVCACVRVFVCLTALLPIKLIISYSQDETVSLPERPLCSLFGCLCFVEEGME